MIYRLLLSGAMLLACGVYATSIDSSGIIFNDSRIHAYELRFYYADWEDSLKYYKNLPDEEYIPARFVYRRGPGDSIVLDSIGVRYKGNSSYNFATSSPKKPFKFSFDKYRAGRTFFGVKKLNFSNGAKDPTMIYARASNRVCHDFHRGQADRSLYADRTGGQDLPEPPFSQERLQSL
jgi:spore coat protein CotH